MKKIKSLFFAILLVSLCIVIFVACDKATPVTTESNKECSHQYEKWVIVKDPACTDDGTQMRTCRLCGNEETKTVSALGHIVTIEEALEATCTTEGKTEGSYCSVCQTVITAQTPIPALGHQSVQDTAIDATCTTDGKTEGTHCSVCQTVITAQNTIPAFGHKNVIDSAVPATCTTDGKTEGTHCSVCQTVITAQTTIPAFGHQPVTDAAVFATCTTDGKTEGAHCSICKTVITAQTIVPAFGHETVIDASFPATCTTDGKTEGSHCGVCQTVIVAQTVIPANGHKYDSGTTVTLATCLNSGVKKFTCTVTSCLHTYNETYSLPTFTATELYEQAVKYVGEIVTYDKNGSKYAIGTGFVISSEGNIVTNYHVIEDAYSAKITINETTYNIVSVLAYDADIDLAVLKIDATNLAAATICKKAVNVGETVYAIGSSRGMTNTYSQGIITYADRIVDGVSHVQHDASITNGNSGGPLINSYGEVIGINTWGISDSQNLNFAVFTGELDNLVYGTPLTMAEFYEKECNVFTKMVNYIVQNGSYNANSNYYRLILGTKYSSDYSEKHTRIAYYYVDDNKITLDFTIDDGDFWAYFIIDENVDGSYLWKFLYTEYSYSMGGTLYAATYNDNTLLGYSSVNMPTSLLKSVRKLASDMISALCSWIDYDFKAIGVTAEDLGFNYY